jgi:hypothetical protein
VVSIVPGIGGIVSIVGFGAVILLMWRIARGGRTEAATAMPMSARAIA